MDHISFNVSVLQIITDNRGNIRNCMWLLRNDSFLKLCKVIDLWQIKLIQKFKI